MAELRSNALTTLEALKEALHSYGTIQTKPENEKGLDLDAPEVEKFLIHLINVMSAQIEGYLNRSLGKKDYSELIKTMYGTTLKVDNYPVREVTAIKRLRGGEINIDDIMFYNDYRNLKEGIIEGAGFLTTNVSFIGTGRHPAYPQSSMRIEYIAGYVLPKDATDDEPSDLPEDIQSIVIETCIRALYDRLQGQSTDNLIALTTGNVKHEWSNPVSAELAKFGTLTKAEQQLLSTYIRRESLYSV